MHIQVTQQHFSFTELTDKGYHGQVENDLHINT